MKMNVNDFLKKLDQNISNNFEYHNENWILN